MAKLTLIDIASGYASIQAINSNNTLIEAAIENTLSRDGSTPNSMSADLDMNSQAIINLPAPLTNNSPARLQDVLDASSSLVSTTAVATTITDSGGFYPGSTNVEGALQDLGSVSTGEGASIIGLEDSATQFVATDVEAALAEIRADLASVATGKGASDVAIEDASTNYTATTVEAALAEIASVSTGEGASIIGVEDSAGNFTATNVETALTELYSLTPQSGTWTPTLQDTSGSDAEGQTYSTQTGKYIKIGNCVFITCYLAMSSLGTLTGAEGARIAGLPFVPSDSVTGGGGHVVSGHALSLAITAGTCVTGQMNILSQVLLQLWDTTAGTSPLLVSEVTANGLIGFSGFYFV